MCLLFFTIFKRQMYFFLSLNEVHWKKFTLQLLFLPTVSRTFILSWTTVRYLPPWNFLFRKNNCMSLSLVQLNNVWREVNQANQVQTNINIVKGLQTSVIHLIPGSTCHWISNHMRYFLKSIFWLKHFPATTNCRSRHLWVFLVKRVLKIS